MSDRKSLDKKNSARKSPNTKNQGLKNRLLDLGYRFMLWSGLSFSLHLIASQSTTNGGQRLAAALSKPPNDDYALVIFGIALFLFVFALLMKDVHHMIKGITVLGRVSSMAVAFIARVSSDLLMSLYGMGAFVIGWMVFDGYRHYNDSLIPDSRVQVLGFGLYEFFGLVIALGAATAVVRVDQDHPLVKSWYEARLIWRLLAYATFILALYYSFWLEQRDLYEYLLKHSG